MTSASETPETGSVSSAGRSNSELNDHLSADDVQHKMPSFKPSVVPSISSTSPLPSTPSTGPVFAPKNGDPLGYAKPIPDAAAACSSSLASNMLGLSPTLLRESGSPQLAGIGSVSLRDVIAKSISKTMKPPPVDPPPHPTAHAPRMEPYKWPTISVKKGLGNEMGGFAGLSGSDSNMGGNNSSMNNQLNNATGTGGKGTRPKRGKYRNYDRDSLVEAVKAVQRGEMSVHRAGSYYGVPHSTLEYKVKERHLMRPRKREPKPQPTDERNVTGGGGGGNAAPPTKANDFGGGKNKASPKNASFDAKSSNGIKGQSYLDSVAQLQYPHLFWPNPPNFTGAAAAAAGLDYSRTPGMFPTENYFAAQMRQRIQDQASAGQTTVSNSSGSGNSSLNNSKSTTPNSGHGNNSSNSRLQGIYDGAVSNGLLDGIIRHSLDRKSTDLGHGTLLDQLKNNLQMAKYGDAEGFKRKREAESPLDFNIEMAIKKERRSPNDNGTTASGEEGMQEERPHSSSLFKLQGGVEGAEDVLMHRRPTLLGGATTNRDISKDNHNLVQDPNRHAMATPPDPDLDSGGGGGGEGDEGDEEGEGDS